MITVSRDLSLAWLLADVWAEVDAVLKQRAVLP